MHKRSGERHLLTHALGQLLTAFPRRAAPDTAMTAGRAPVPRRTRCRLPRGRQRSRELHRPQLLVDHRLVRDPGHDSSRPDGIGERVDTKDSDRAAVGFEEAGDQTQCGCLTGAVGPEQRVEFSGEDAEIQPIPRGALKTFVRPSNLEGRRWRRRIPVRCLAEFIDFILLRDRHFRVRRGTASRCWPHRGECFSLDRKP
jgi:hypothetical protein